MLGPSARLLLQASVPSPLPDRRPRTGKKGAESQRQERWTFWWVVIYLILSLGRHALATLDGQLVGPMVSSVDGRKTRTVWRHDTMPFALGLHGAWGGGGGVARQALLCPFRRKARDLIPCAPPSDVMLVDDLTSGRDTGRSPSRTSAKSTDRRRSSAPRCCPSRA